MTSQKPNIYYTQEPTSMSRRSHSSTRRLLYFVYRKKHKNIWLLCKGGKDGWSIFFLFEMQKWEKEQISLKQHYVAITHIGDVCTTTVAWSRNLKWFLRLICEIKAGGFKNSFNHVRKQQSPVLKQLEGSTRD